MDGNKKKINIKFCGFWPGFDSNNNFLINSLKEKYDFVDSDNPDYLISSCFSSEYLKYNCVRIFYTGENLCPNFNLFDYAIGFEYLDFGDRYIRYPNYCITDTYAEDNERMMKKHIFDEDILREKTDFCAFVVSKGDKYVAKEREEFFRALSSYKKVNSGGRFLNNIGIPEGIIDKYEFQKKHKFTIAFENSSHDGYTTEKLMQAFAAGTVPIYWGDPKVGEVFNEKAFINVNSYKSIDDVIKLVKDIDEDDVKYMKMLSVPALIGNDYLYYNKMLSRFLDSIFAQPLDLAVRRDCVGYGKLEEDKIRCFEGNKSKVCKRLKKFLIKLT